MSIENRLEAAAKNVEGKVQEFVGKVTGNPEDKAAGKAKQAEANFRHATENIKEQAHGEFDSVENRLKATAKNVEGKVQQFVGEVTGNPEDKAAGKAKQTEAQVRHSVENLKDNFR